MVKANVLKLDEGHIKVFYNYFFYFGDCVKNLLSSFLDKIKSFKHFTNISYVDLKVLRLSSLKIFTIYLRNN